MGNESIRKREMKRVGGNTDSRKEKYILDAFHVISIDFVVSEHDSKFFNNLPSNR
jgi:hypothetical protein